MMFLFFGKWGSAYLNPLLSQWPWVTVLGSDLRDTSVLDESPHCSVPQSHLCLTARSPLHSGQLGPPGLCSSGVDEFSDRTVWSTLHHTKNSSVWLMAGDPWPEDTATPGAATERLDA